MSLGVERLVGFLEDGIEGLPAGHCKVVALEAALEITAARTVYVGDGRSKIHAMPHVNSHGAITAAVSRARSIAQVAGAP